MLGEQLKEQNYYGKCHIIVQFEFAKSRLSIVRLSDSDIYDTFQEPAKNDLAVLKRYLNHCSRYNEITPTYKLYKQSKLTFALRDTLNETTNNRLLCCISNNPAAFINSIKTLDVKNIYLFRLFEWAMYKHNFFFFFVNYNQLVLWSYDNWN